MKTKISFGFIFLVINAVIFISFYLWVITPMWYADVGYQPYSSPNLPKSGKVNKELEAKLNTYRKKLKKLQEKN